MTEQRQITRRGLSVAELEKLTCGKKLYIWGAARMGKAIYRALSRNGFGVQAFIDKNPYYHDITFQGIKTYAPDAMFNSADFFKDSFIFLGGAAFPINREMEKTLLANENYKRAHEDGSVGYINHANLSPFHPSVDIAGLCNLKCIACPVGDSSRPHEKGGFMSAETYKKVLEKLLSDIPFLLDVALYLWGDPLLNPALPEIIRINETYGVGYDLSTNLNYAKYIEALIKANPSDIRVSTSGFGPENYEKTHLGAKWSVFYENLVSLRGYIDKYKADTIVNVYFHLNKINASDYKALYDFCKKMDYRLRVHPSTIFPDLAFDYVEGKELSKIAKDAIDVQFYSMEKLMDIAKSKHDKKCPNSYCIPNIAWDTSLFECCNYMKKMKGNFFDYSLSELIDVCNASEFCDKCVGLSLHAYRSLSAFENDMQKYIFDMHQLPDRL